MNLDQQVCSLELAKRLKELGVEKESLFYYLNIDGEGEYYVYFNEHMPEEFEYEGDPISAFTVAELGEMLDHTMGSVRCSIVKDEWIAVYDLNGVLKGCKFRSKTEADVRAKMLIYLIENKFIEVSK